MNITIRREQPEDYRTVEEITREAFWNLYQPGCEEHFIVHTLRKHPDFIEDLTFVIEVDGKIVGSIFYSHAKVIDDHGEEYQLISFGPVSIHPSLHRKGLGRALITHSIEAAKKRGHPAIIIGGFPYHYKSYGFRGAKQYGISMPDKQFYTGIMALPLYAGALDQIAGCVHFSTGLYVSENDLEQFDQSFLQKKKEVLPSQAKFQEAVAEIDRS